MHKVGLLFKIPVTLSSRINRMCKNTYACVRFSFSWPAVQISQACKYVKTRSPATFQCTEIGANSKATLFFISRRIASRVHEISDLKNSSRAQS